MSRRRRALLLALLVVAAVPWFAYLSIYEVDDAYIVYRYADNLAHGEGFVFNEGERVEGVTCFLWTLALVPFAAIERALPSIAPLLTGAAGVAILLLLPGLSARLRGAAGIDGFDLAASALLVSHPAFAYWSVGRLETVPYTLLLVLGVRAHAIERDRGSGRISAVFLGLATLMRPEAPVLAAGLAVDRFLTAESPRAGIRSVVPWGAVVAAFFGSLLVFRALYFGDLLPNTYYAKASGGLAANLASGLRYTLRFLPTLVPSFDVENAGTVLAGGLALAALLVHGVRSRALRPAALLVLALVVAVLLEGGDWMVLHRFWVPALPFLSVLAVDAGRALRRAGKSPRVLVPALGLLLFASGIVAGIRERDGINGLAVNAAGYEHAHHAVAAYLREHAEPGDCVALMDVGIIGYEGGRDLRVLDISGLTDARIARMPGRFLDKQVPAETILARNPRFLVLVDGFPIDARIATSPGFLDRYRLVMERNHRFNWTPPDSYTLHLFERIER